MLLFEVKEQKLKRLDAVEPATDSQQYLKAKFTIKDEDWNGKAKTAYFRLGEAVYKALLNSNNECVVPSEVLIRNESKYARTQGSKIFVSLVGEYSTTRITTNEVQIELNTSGYADAEEPAAPTESEYQQIITQLAANQTEMGHAREDLQGVKNIFANAIKGNISGAVVSADDVSPVEHTVNLWGHSRNLANLDVMLNEAFSKNENGTYTLAKKTDEMRFTELVPFFVPKGTKLTISGHINNDNCKDNYFATQMYGVDKKAYYPSFLKSGNTIYGTYTVPVDVTSCRFYLQNTENDGAAVTFKNLQIEVGTTATEYTPYIDPTTMTVTANGQTYTPNSDGTVDGISSVALAGGISVDTEGAVVECEYIKDTNKVIQKIAEALNITI